VPRLFLDACIVIDLVKGRPSQQSELNALSAGNLGKAAVVRLACGIVAAINSFKQRSTR
jgi:hypothetical protein